MTIIGPNGSGKTTLIRVLLGLVKPSSGTILREKNIKIGYVPQKISIDYALPLKVKDFLGLIAPRSDVLDVLHAVGADHLVHCSVHHLSGGEFQRMLLAQALLNTPHILILDEPLQGVDVLGQEALYTLIAETQKRIQCTVVLVSHDLHFVHMASDHVICLNSHVCCAGRPQDIKNNPKYQAIFGGAMMNSFALYHHVHDHEHHHHAAPEGQHDRCRHD